MTRVWPLPVVELVLEVDAWGPRDCRMVDPEGYYLRITAPPEAASAT
jgi:hypothetical protein